MTPDPEPRPPLPRNVWLLGWVSLLNDIASEMVYPLLGQLMERLVPGGKAYLGLMEGVAGTATSLLQLFSGAWSDRLRLRKVFVAVGYVLTVFVRPLLALASLPWQVVACRTADRVGKGLRTPARDALLADCTPPEIRGRAFGLQRAMDQFGAAIGPILAALILFASPDNLPLVFLLTLIPGIGVVALVVFGLREAPPKSTAAKPLPLTLAPFGGAFKLYLVSLVIFTLGNTSDLFLLARAHDRGIDNVWLPVLWGAFNVISSIGSLLAGRLIDRVGARVPIFFGWLLYAAVYFGFAFATSAWQVCGLFLCYSLFYSLTEPAEKAFVAALAGSSERRGLAYGWFNFAIGIATLPANILFGWLYQRFGATTAFGWGAAMALLAAALLVGVKNPTVQRA
ncbi:MAG: MFS transporter [Planctomycetia bacterium]|nr:MFS transporter [Planctomycetia bacterium]